MEEDRPNTIEVYDRDAESIAATYESFAFTDVHRGVLDLLPEHPGLILDIGAGSGRDAAWFASHGHDVIALEPSGRMREIGRAAHPEAQVRWIDDRLPGLEAVIRSGQTFDLIWLSAVWMHVAPSSRERAFRKLVTVLRPGGRMMFSLRQGLAPFGREMYPAHADEIERLARRHGLSVVLSTSSPDRQGRSGVSWQTFMLQAPDDGLGALPLLRHIIINDSKSSTYKLALLRVLVRIADSAMGLVEDIDDDTVGVPLGLVALYWIRAYKPLVEHGVLQMPENKAGAGLGFVKAGFTGLRQVSPFSLRLGARFTGVDAQLLMEALRDARNTIAKMPAHFITYPGSGEQVFVVESDTVRKKTEFVLDREFLGGFGRMRLPRHIWQAMSRYAAWIEPALVSEWVELMRGYERANSRSHDQYHALLRWLDPLHDTNLVRQIAQQLRDQDHRLACVWTDRRLRAEFDVDHCLPFAAWPCNDLWNLLPAHATTNRKKGSRLPSAETLWNARGRITDWWSTAFIDNSELQGRFIDEAVAALPATLSGADPTPADIFDGLMLQRASLKRDQQLEEW